jgi:hypothetical protein
MSHVYQGLLNQALEESLEPVRQLATQLSNFSNKTLHVSVL